MFIYDLSILLTSTAFVDTKAKYGIPLSRYTVFFENCPLEYNSKDMTFLEIPLGDALFVADIDHVNMRSVNRWQDTAHFHVDNEIHVILKGSAEIEIGGRDVLIKSGDVCLLSPNSSHYPKSFSEDLEKADFSFSLRENGAFVRCGRRFSEYAYYRGVFGSVGDYLVVNDPQLLDILKRLISEQFGEAEEHIFKALFSVFFILLAKRIRESRPQYDGRERGIVYESDNIFRQRKTVEEFFQKRYNEDVGIDDLARELCLSVPHTHRVVKRIFGAGFKKTLTKQRIDHACMLIKQHALPLNEIAYLSGYSSYNGFLSAFKGYTGKTPKEYEKQLS